jgi:hypothetical protein
MKEGILNKWYYFDNTIEDEVNEQFIKPLEILQKGVFLCEVLSINKGENDEIEYHYFKSIELYLDEDDFEDYKGDTEISDEYIKELIGDLGSTDKYIK